MTITSNANDAFSPYFPAFTYKGISEKRKTEVKVTVPSYPENLMFYEHIRDSHLYMLSFMYLGKNTEGQVNYNFRDYKTVEKVEFSHEIQSVNLAFQVISQLPNCKEVEFHLDYDDVLFSSEPENAFDKCNVFSCNSRTVKVLRISRLCNKNFPISGKIVACFTKIMKYAKLFLPNLEHLYVINMGGGGTSYDAVADLCTNLPRHSIRTENGLTFCEPFKKQGVSSNPRKALNQGDRNVPRNVPLNVGSVENRFNQPIPPPPNQPTLPPPHQSEIEPEVVVAETELKDLSPLTRKKSPFDDWENSSDEEREKYQNPAKPARKFANPPPSVELAMKNDLEVREMCDNAGNNVIDPSLAAKIPMDKQEIRNIVNLYIFSLFLVIFIFALIFTQRFFEYETRLITLFL